MGYLLKEALKTLCGVNQWSYAVFWKIGCQNPKLLIWEECYYEPASWSMLGNENPQTNIKDYNSSLIPTEIRSLQAGDKVHMLVNKMMMNHHVNIVGEGLVGRVAFTGNHQWILSENYHKEAHPPEVLKEVDLQFSAGMKTVAVIPVLPHGVVLFGSQMKIIENMGFVSDVTSLVLQLGYVPGVLVSENYGSNELLPKIGTPVCLANSMAVDFPVESNAMNDSSLLDNFNYISNSTQAPVFHGQQSYSVPGEFQNDLQSAFQASSSSTNHLKPHNYLHEVKVAAIPMKSDSSQNQLMNGLAKAEVISSNIDTWMNQHVSSLYIPNSTMGMPSRCPSALIPDPSLSSDMLMSAVRTNSGLTSISNTGSIALPSIEVNGGRYVDVKPASAEGSVSGSKKPVTENLHSLTSGLEHHLMNKKFTQTELKIEKNMTMACDIPISLPNVAGSIPGFVEDERKEKHGNPTVLVNNSNFEDACVQPKSGDDLFDILGADFKNQLFGSQWNGGLNNVSSESTHIWNKSSIPTKKSSEIHSTSQGNSDTRIFSMSAADHLLDAVVSKVQPSFEPGFEDTVSCGTTLTNVSSSAAPSTSLPYGRFGVPEQMKGELYGIPKYLAKGGGASSSALRAGAPKEDSGTFSQGSSMYGSQISSWMENSQSTKQSNSVSTGYSKKSDEPTKTNRKRPKPGENPRPRPKDRQMIQDRVKELREIVPNGAKCSIDALLERTIKHMLFLQSVTKHADKLKQAGESKIICKDGGLLLKDNFEGGATWAYEVGSQSMVCPIIVEDLNQPRQMLVEMLCEERGLFLEIADIIRGLGLTILKGVMETQNDKIWARFAVEANRDVTRMEIFISLVRLLEQSSKNGVPQQSNVENTMPRQYHQAPPIPVTSISHSLQ